MIRRIRWANHSKLLSFVVFFVACLVHLRSLANGFALDDYTNIVENPNLRGIRLLFAALFEPSFPGNLYRPAQTFTYGLIYLAFGLNPLPFHVLGVLLHGGVAVLLFRLFSQLVVIKVALLATLLWSVLPCHTEAVANAAGIAELLAAAFGLAALYSSLTRRPHWVTGLLFALALSSKESAFVFPFLLLVLCQARWESVREKLGVFLGVGAGFLLIRLMVVGYFLSGSLAEPLDNQLLNYSGWTQKFYALSLLGKYVLTAFLPLELSSDYSYNHFFRWFEEGSLLPWSGILISISLLALACTKKYEVNLGLRWFFVAFALTSNIFFSIGTVFAERLLYVPSMGLALVLVNGLLYIGWQRFGITLFFAFSVVSSLQDSIWKSNRNLYYYQMGISPMSAKTQHNFGVLMRNSGDLSEAAIHIRRALEIYPCYADGASTLGSIYIMRGLPSGADHWFRNALKCDPTHPPTLNRIGRLSFNLGKLDVARGYFRQALASNPKNVEAAAGLLAVSIQSGNIEESRRLITFLNEVAPDSNEVKRLVGRFEEGVASISTPAAK